MSDLKVRLSGYLPAAEMDGLQPLREALVLDPKERRIAVVVLDTATRRDHGDGEYEPTVRVLQIELPQGELREAAEKILHAAYSQRTGAMQMFEDDGSNWGVGGQAGQPLVAPTDDSEQGDWAPPEEELETGAEQADDDLADLAQQEELEGAPAEDPEQPAAVQAQDATAERYAREDAEQEAFERAGGLQTQDAQFMAPEPPAPVQDQVAKRRSRKAAATA